MGRLNGVRQHRSNEIALRNEALGDPRGEGPKSRFGRSVGRRRLAGYGARGYARVDDGDLVPKDDGLRSDGGRDLGMLADHVGAESVRR